MADKTTGGLPAVQEAAIGDLPGIADLYDDTLLPVEQQGEARHMTGAQWRGYAEAGARRYAELAEMAANKSGYFYVEIQPDGCLHYIRSDRTVGLNFKLENGELIINDA